MNEPQPYEMKEAAAELERAWQENLPTLAMPDHEQFQRWVRVHDGQTADLLRAIQAAAKKLRYCPNAFNDAYHPIAHISAVANHYRRQRASLAAVAA